MVFVYLEGYAASAPSYTTCPDANRMSGCRCQMGTGDSRLPPTGA